MGIAYPGFVHFFRRNVIQKVTIVTQNIVLSILTRKSKCQHSNSRCESQDLPSLRCNIHFICGERAHGKKIMQSPSSRFGWTNPYTRSLLDAQTLASKEPVYGLVRPSHRSLGGLFTLRRRSSFMKERQTNHFLWVPLQVWWAHYTNVGDENKSHRRKFALTSRGCHPLHLDDNEHKVSALNDLWIGQQQDHEDLTTWSPIARRLISGGLRVQVEEIEAYSRTWTPNKVNKITGGHLVHFKNDVRHNIGRI